MGALFGGGSQVDEWRGSDWARSGWNQYFDKDNPNREGTFTRLVQDTYGGPNAFQYQGQRVAEVDPWQNYAAQKIGEVNVAPGLDMAQRWLDQTISGVNTQGPGQDWQDAAWRNEYMGQNTYFDQMLTQAKQSTIDDYKDIIAPQEATAATMAGAFGGGAYQKQVGRNQGQLMDKRPKARRCPHARGDSGCLPQPVMGSLPARAGIKASVGPRLAGFRGG